MVVPARIAYRLPAGTPPWIGALTEPLACCIHGMDRFAPRSGLPVLIYGAGPAGAMMVALARSRGLAPVVVHGSPRRTGGDLALRMGADAALDPTDAGQRGGGPGPDRRAGLPVRRRRRRRRRACWSPRSAWPARGGRILVFGVARPDEEARVRPHEVFARELTMRRGGHQPVHAPPAPCGCCRRWAWIGCGRPSTASTSYRRHWRRSAPAPPTRCSSPRTASPQLGADAKERPSPRSGGLQHAQDEPEHFQPHPAQRGQHRRAAPRPTGRLRRRRAAVRPRGRCSRAGGVARANQTSTRPRAPPVAPDRGAASLMRIRLTWVLRRQRTGSAAPGRSPRCSSRPRSSSPPHVLGRSGRRGVRGRFAADRGGG